MSPDILKSTTLDPRRRAALRIAIDAKPRQLRVLKCRGGLAPARPIALPQS